ncbi:MAG: hypothetical protein ACT4QB_05780 [Gammaproteobacteria bacterium]
MSASLYVAMSYHGFGHIAQTGPIVNALRTRIPDLRLTLRCAAPLDVLQGHFRGSFEHMAEPVDDAMAMANSLDVLAPASYAAYLETHRRWRVRVGFEARSLRELRPSLVLANIPYLPLAAAAEAGIPALALCSLHWGAVFYHYCRDNPEADAIRREILAAYHCAGVFLNPEPSMPMPGLPDCRAVGPIARIGRDRKAEIAARLGIDPGDKLVLLFLGGIPTPVRFTEWRIPRGVVLLVSGTHIDGGGAVYPIEAAGVSYIDVVASADALITKPGYGSFVEAACNGIPVLYTRRRDWPEEPYTIRWLARHARCRELERAELEQGRIADALQALWAQPERPAVAPTGIAEAATIIASYLDSPTGRLAHQEQGGVRP